MPRGGAAEVSEILRAVRPLAEIPRATIAALVAGNWALRAGSRVRAHLRARGLAEQPPLPPVPNDPGGTRAVELALKLSRRSCLERALVAQAWHAERGDVRDMIVGVRGPSNEFVAHAWLEGELPDEPGLVELTRYPYRRACAVARGARAEPRTTVVIPVWEEPYVSLLEEAIASVGRQGVEALIVIVDNASEVELPALAKHEVLRSDRRLSRGEARNLGLHRVETEFVLFLDADDLLIDGTIARLQSELDSDPGPVACAGSILEGEVGADVIHGRHSVPRRFVPALSRRRRLFAFATAVWPLYSTQGGTLIRTESIAAQAYDDSDGGEDWVLGVSLAMRGVRVIDRPGMIYRLHSGSSRSSGPRTPAYLWAAAARVRMRIGEDPAVPRPIRIARPLLWLGQALVIRLLFPRLRVSPAPRQKSAG